MIKPNWQNDHSTALEEKQKITKHTEFAPHKQSHLTMPLIKTHWITTALTKPSDDASAKNKKKCSGENFEKNGEKNLGKKTEKKQGQCFHRNVAPQKSGGVRE